MFIFFLISLCLAADQTYTIGTKAEIVIKFDKDKLQEKILNKCENAEFFNFKITKESEKLKFNIYKTSDCSGTALVSIDMKEVSKQLPQIQEEITIDASADVKLTLGLPYGCLLNYLPEITGDAKGQMNFEFVHTQFGADVHLYKPQNGKVEECKGIDTIVNFFKNGDVKNAVKMILTEANVTIGNLAFGQGAINMFETIKKELYEYKDKFPTFTDEYLYEFNGKVMKIYQKIEENGAKFFKYVEDAVIPNMENIIGKLKDATGKELNITAECDPKTGNSFGYYDGKLQMTTAKNCNFDINGFNLNFRLNISAIMGKENKISINNKNYTFTELSNYAKDLKTQAVAVINSFGSNLEFELNKCKTISFFNIIDTFQDLAQNAFGNIPVVGPLIVEAIQKGEDVRKIIEEKMKDIHKYVPNFNLPDYYYKVSMLKTGKEGKSFATYSFYDTTDSTCTKNPMFEFVIGVVTDLKVQDIQTGFQLTRYLEKESCSSKKGKEGYYNEHVQVEKCINGYKFKYENNELKMIKCDNKKQAAENDNTAYKCDTCVECQKKAAMSGDYAYVTCGSSSIFVLLVVLMFFILF